MNKDQALSLALEALEPDWELAEWYVDKLRDKAIAAIKQALEQPEPPCKTGSQCISKCDGCAEPEPVAWMQNTTAGLYVSDQPDQWHTVPLYTSPPKRESLTDVIKAAQGVLEWTEIAHRPPKRDELEGGRMVRVRLHALADLHEALVAHGIKKENT